MNEYKRKVGFFGSIKTLGVTTISGANDITIDTVGVATDLTGTARVASSILKESAKIFGSNIIEDLRADAEIDAIHRQIASIQQTAELDMLKAELAKQSAKRPVGRPAK